MIQDCVLMEKKQRMQVFSDVLNKGCFEIQNPTVLTPNEDEVQVKGCFRIKEI